MNQYIKKPVPVTAFQWIEGQPWVEGMRLSGDGNSIPVCQTKNGPVPVNSGDWIMRGDGEHYPCPDEVFKKTYVPARTPSLNLNFGEAVEALKSGKKVSRTGWNGKGMYLVYVPSFSYNPQGIVAPLGLEKLPWIGMKTADNKFVPWLASQTDVLAEDWSVVE